MRKFRDYDRSQRILLPPDLSDWVADDGLSLPEEVARRETPKTIEPVFGIIKSILGFTRFHLRGIEKVKSECALVTLAYSCKRLGVMMARQKSQTTGRVSGLKSARRR